MIIDTSAVVAIFFKEPGFEELLDKVISARSKGIGAPTLAETGIVLSVRLDADARGLMGRFVQEFEIETVPFGDAHWREVVEAYFRFGKGRHPASLNFGDCLTYACARLASQPLLFVGGDFSKTDLEIA